ncbi:hypothetical protein DFJ77DRAFT_157398 [Powellomyces hirtus]|nr:hypothetical protein DFJ77DRAFT_157398 [Powellomyces hirtus]
MASCARERKRSVPLRKRSAKNANLNTPTVGPMVRNNSLLSVSESECEEELPASRPRRTSRQAADISHQTDEPVVRVPEPPPRPAPPHECSENAQSTTPSRPALRNASRKRNARGASPSEALEALAEKVPKRPRRPESEDHGEGSSRQEDSGSSSAENNTVSLESPQVPPETPDSTVIDLTKESGFIDLSESPVVRSRPPRPPQLARVDATSVYDLTGDDSEMDNGDIQVVHHIPGTNISYRRRQPSHANLSALDLTSPASDHTSWTDRVMQRMLGRPPVSIPPNTQPYHIFASHSIASMTTPTQPAAPPPLIRPPFAPVPPIIEPEDTPAPLKCAICLDAMGEGCQLSATTCGHIFCNSCIQEAFKKKKECPICRKALKGKNPFIRLFT